VYIDPRRLKVGYFRISMTIALELFEKPTTLLFLYWKQPAQESKGPPVELYWKGPGLSLCDICYAKLILIKRSWALSDSGAEAFSPFPAAFVKPLQQLSDFTTLRILAPGP
jgi:hypothetical protein